MSELRERQKAEAVKRMKKLGIMEQLIKEFEEEGKLNLSENGGLLYWLNEEEQKMVDYSEKPVKYRAEMKRICGLKTEAEMLAAVQRALSEIRGG